MNTSSATTFLMGNYNFGVSSSNITVTNSQVNTTNCLLIVSGSGSGGGFLGANYGIFLLSSSGAFISFSCDR
jgi:hypothetical protein